MIRLEKAGAEDLETIIAIQRASFKAVYDKYKDRGCCGNGGTD